MGKDQANEEAVRLLRKLASDPPCATTTSTAHYDMMSYGLKISDVCDALWDWIKAGKPVMRTVMHGRDSGQAAYEIWPEFEGRRFYCKFIVQGEDSLNPTLFIVSVHPDRPESIRRGGTT